LELIPLPGTRGPDTIDGLYLTNLSRGAKAGSLPLGEGWTLAADGAVEASGAVGVRMLPGQVKLESTLPSSKFELRCIGQPATPWVLMGSNTGTRLELRGAEAGLSVEQRAGRVVCSTATLRRWTRYYSPARAMASCRTRARRRCRRFDLGSTGPA
jgi:hypothetical protein